MTALPIDYRRRPWKPKYLDEETPVLNRWMIFGEFDGGTVCISDGDGDIFERVPRDVADEIVAARNAFVDVVMKHFANWEKT